MNDVEIRAWVIYFICATALCLFGLYMSHKQTTEFTAECQAKNGHPAMTKLGWVCLDKKFVIPVRQPNGQPITPNGTIEQE